MHSRLEGDYRDKNDQARLRHGRERNEGFAVGDYRQSAPLLFSRDGHALYLGDMFRGRPAFLIAGGPSFATVDKEKLQRPGCLTMALNNAVHSFRPDLWVSVDDPTHFMKSIWLDSKIMKFVPLCHAEKSIFDNDAWKATDQKVGDCPNVFYYRRNERFRPEQFLKEDTINWGNHSKLGGGRSVMLAAIRLLFFLGVRQVYLLGVDFKMSKDQKYHFEQNRSTPSIRGNNSTYRKLRDWFRQLKPVFEEHDFHISNCNPDSQLDVFPFVSFDEAVKHCQQGLPDDPKEERTEGLYDRVANAKRDKRKVNGAGQNQNGTVLPSAIPVRETLKAADRMRESGTKVEEAIYTMCDENYSRFLPWWLSRIRAFNTQPVFVYDLGVPKKIKRLLNDEARFVEPPPIPLLNHPSIPKPFYLLCASAERGLYLDVDCEVRGDLTPLLRVPTLGSLAMVRDKVRTGQFKSKYGDNYYNTGIIGFSRGDPLLVDWAKATAASKVELHTDRELFNTLVPNWPEQPKEFPNGTVKLRLGPKVANPLVIHWTGQTGKRAIENSEGFKTTPNTN